ncbi:MAG: biotin--[acetyl-CoA-carboxylase] ligase [Bacteroidales bacterium]|nr:biotin--[acetyl-CoA-carboxylase] ligase [Bacteroidales bacterium]
MEYLIQKLDTVSSTNNYLKSLLKSGEIPEGTVIMADYQSEGRGRGNNGWHSAKGMNLIFSILFKPGISAGDHFFLTEFISLAITDALKSVGIETTIKWPNDIYWRNKKLAGLLIENIINQDKVQTCIVGIGLNVNETDFPEDLPNPISIKQIIKRGMDREELLNQILKALDIRYHQLTINDFIFIHNEYNNQLYLRDTVSHYKVKGEIVEAAVIGIRKNGELKLQHLNGEIKKYLFGEVEYM